MHFGCPGTTSITDLRRVEPGLASVWFSTATRALFLSRSNRIFLSILFLLCEILRPCFETCVVGFFCLSHGGHHDCSVDRQRRLKDNTNAPQDRREVKAGKKADPQKSVTSRLRVHSRLLSCLRPVTTCITRPLVFAGRICRWQDARENIATRTGSTGCMSMITLATKRTAVAQLGHAIKKVDPRIHPEFLVLFDFCRFLQVLLNILVVDVHDF